MAKPKTTPKFQQINISQTTNISILKNQIIAGVRNFINKYQVYSPLTHLTEADIQADLSSEIKNFVSPIDIKDPHDFAVLGPLSLIHREWSLGNKIRPDIVCIDPEQIESSIKNKAGTPPQEIFINHLLWQLPLLVGIEIKYKTYDDASSATIDDVIRTVTDDFNKLKNHKTAKIPNLLSLYFFQDERYFDQITNNPSANHKIQLINANDTRYNYKYLIGHDHIYEIIQTITSSTSSPPIKYSSSIIFSDDVDIKL